MDHQPVASDSPVRIQREQRNFEIQYTALSFIHSENIPFRYRLAGLDHEWTEAGTRRTAYYSHIPPGEYNFQVIAANSDQVWNQTGQTLHTSVLPSFYRTWWFAALASLAAVCALMLAWRNRLSQLERMHAAQRAFSHRLIETQEADRKRIAAELHDSLGQNLLIIKNRAALGTMANRDLDSAKQQLEEISASASDAIEEVRQIAYNLRPYYLDRLGLTSSLEEMIERITRSTDILISYDIAALDGALRKSAEINLYRFVQECLNNVVKHSQAAEASLRVSRDIDDLKITIADNGKGFTTPLSAGSHERGGFGLSGIAERVDILAGTYSISSSENHGTTIDIRVPVQHEGPE